MSIQKTVTAVATQFDYQKDPKWWIDPWTVMKQKQGKLRGDCDDFTITCLYRHLGFWAFIWRVCITHSAQIHRVKTPQGDTHVVGCVEGYWFDNFTLCAIQGREQFFIATGHTYLMRYYAPLFLIKLIAGLFRR